MANRIASCNGGVKVGLGGRFAALCYREVHSESCKSQCNGGVKVAWGGTFAALCEGEVHSESWWVCGAVLGGSGKRIQRVANRWSVRSLVRELQIALSW